MAPLTLTPIGTVRSTRNTPTDDGWDAETARIELDPDQFEPEALAGLEDFSHVEVLFIFDRVADEKVVRGARHPRGRKDWPKAGIFAQRGKNRPNKIGATVCRILEVDGLALHLEGLDAIEGSPVLDIKPVMTAFLPRGEIREPQWVTEVMANYWELPAT